MSAQLEMAAWRVNGGAWNRLTARRIALRSQITLALRTQPRVEQDWLGGPASVSELRSWAAKAKAAATTA